MRPGGGGHLVAKPRNPAVNRFVDEKFNIPDWTGSGGVDVGAAEAEEGGGEQGGEEVAPTPLHPPPTPRRAIPAVGDS